MERRRIMDPDAPQDPGAQITAPMDDGVVARRGPLRFGPRCVIVRGVLG